MPHDFTRNNGYIRTEYLGCEDWLVVDVASGVVMGVIYKAEDEWDGCEWGYLISEGDATIASGKRRSAYEAVRAVTEFHRFGKWAILMPAEYGPSPA